MTLRPRKTNRRKRRRVIVDKQGFTSSPTLVMPELEYCTNCRKTVPVGDPKHALHSRFSLDEEASDAPVTRRDTAINLANASELVLPRFKTGWEGFDRVVGGGLVINSITLIGGAPAIGKSTLLMALAAALSVQYTVLYISGEEIEQQLGDRARRMSVSHASVKILHTKDVAVMLREITRINPDIVIVDSAQTFADVSGNVPGAAGSVSQVHHVGEVLTAVAKNDNRAVILVCQETKDGDLAGPKQLEHLVDTVLRFDRDETDRRFLFGKKNRFGPAFETAIYDMTKRGLVEVGDVTSAVLEERLGAVGVVPFAAAHLARPVLLAVEASAIEIKEDMSTRPVETEGYPAVRLRRVLDRLQHDLDLITRGYALRVEVPRVLGDVVDDDELDLAVAAAVLSAIRNRPPPRAMVFGKVSFSGHVVSMVRSEQRLEAGLLHVLAINEAIVPMRTVVPDGVNARRVRSISELEMAMWPTGAAGSVGRVRQPTFLGELQVGALPEAAGDMVDAVRDADVVDEPVDDPVDEMIVAEWDAPMVTFLDDQSAGDVSITTDHGTTEAPRPKATRRSRKKG